MRLFLYGCLVVSMGVGVGRAAVEASTPLTLDDCIGIALRMNRQARVADLDADIAESQRKQAKASYWPRLNADLGASHMAGDPVFTVPYREIYVDPMTVTSPEMEFDMPIKIIGDFEITIPVKVPSAEIPVDQITVPVPEQQIPLFERDMFVATLNLTYPLYTGGERPALLKQAEYGVEASSHEQRRTDAKILRDVSSAYYATVLADDLAAYSHVALKRVQDLFSADLAKGAGDLKARPAEALRARALWGNAFSLIAYLEGKSRQARFSLVNAMGLPPGEEVELAMQELPDLTRSVDPAQLTEQALETNPQLAALRAGLKASEQSVKRAKSGHLPKIVFLGNMSHFDNHYEKGLADPHNRNSWTVGVGADLPLFRGFQTVNEVKESKAAVQRMREEQILAEEGLALQIDLAHTDLVRSLKQATFVSQSLAAAIAHRELLHKDFDGAGESLRKLIESELTELNLLTQHEKARFDHLRAQLDLDYLGGDAAFAME